MYNINKCGDFMKKMVLIFLTLLLVNLNSSVFAQADIRALHLTWSEDTKSTQTITWQMHEFNPNIRVEYGEIGLPADFPKKVMADVEPFPDETGVSHVYHVTLQGLKSNKEYFYRIVDGDITIKEANFKMGKNLDSCDFLVFGDSQSYNYKVWGETLKAAYTQNPNAEFFVNVGDLVDNGQRISEWENWFLNGKDIMIHLPIVPVVGNHETYTPQKGIFSMPKYFTSQFVLPQNGPEKLKEQVYSFDYANVHFVVLDTQFGEERSFVPDSLERQIEWIKKDLAETDKKWKVVFMHRAPYHNRADRGFDQTIKFVPIFEEFNVDVVFTAHDHVCARTPAMRAGLLTDDGVIYATTGRSGTKVYQTVIKKEWNSTFLNPLDEPTYSMISVNEKKFTVKVLSQSGKLIDKWDIDKF